MTTPRPGQDFAVFTICPCCLEPLKYSQQRGVVKTQSIIENVMGCAGLNSAAYRACVEALRAIINIESGVGIGGEAPELDEWRDALDAGVAALTLAQREGT